MTGGRSDAPQFDVRFCGAVCGRYAGDRAGDGNGDCDPLNLRTFGKGDLRGIAATEYANSSVAGSDFITLLTLGLPGSASAAIMTGAFLIQGIQPGPLLFEQQGQQAAHLASMS